jgi:hypothetical protein
MFNVDKNYSDSSYVDQYLKNNLIIDSNKTKINTNSYIEENRYKIVKELDKNTENKYNEIDCLGVYKILIFMRIEIS